MPRLKHGAVVKKVHPIKEEHARMPSVQITGGVSRIVNAEK